MGFVNTTLGIKLYPQKGYWTPSLEMSKQNKQIKQQYLVLCRICGHLSKKYPKTPKSMLKIQRLICKLFESWYVFSKNKTGTSLQKLFQTIVIEWYCLKHGKKSGFTLTWRWKLPDATWNKFLWYCVMCLTLILALRYLKWLLCRLQGMSIKKEVEFLWTKECLYLEV